MKNKILPLSLVTLVIFLGAFLISATSAFPESFLADPDNVPDGTDRSLASTHLTKIRANQHTQVVDPADVLRAREAVLGNTRSSEAELGWKFLGPDNVGGFTKALLFDNRDETGKTIIAGAFTGGLYKSTNSGLTWSKINGTESNLHVSCIGQAADGTIYIGTGGYFMGSGIYKSMDGENFERLTSTIGEAAFTMVNELAVDQQSGAVYVSTEMGIYYSSDAGQTWNMAKTGDGMELAGVASDVNIGSNGITAVAVDGLCYISENGAPEQFALHSSDTFNLPYENVSSLELAIAPSNPDILYATVLDQFEEMMNIYRSDNKGVNWRIIAPGGSVTLPLTFDFAHNVLEVFPNDPDKIIVSGADMWEGTKIDEDGYFQWVQKSDGSIPAEIFPSYVHTWHYSCVFRPGVDNQFLVGHNGGISRGTINSIYYEFVELNKTYSTSQAMKVGLGGFKKVLLSSYDQNGVQIIDGQGNPAQAANGTQIWGQLPPWGGNGGEVFLSVIDPNIAIYSLVGGEFRRSEDLGANFSTTFLGTGMAFTDDYFAPAVYWEDFENTNSRDSVGYKVNETIPAGTELWIHSNNRAYPFKYTTPETYYDGDSLVIQDPVSTKMFIGADNAVWMTTGILDFAAAPEWFQVAGAASGFDGLVSALALSGDANFLFVGTEEGHVYRVANLATAYDYDRADVRSPYCIVSTAEIPLIDPTSQAQNTQVITSISIDPDDANKIVVTLGNYGNDHYVFKSTNALGANPGFASIQGNLPKMPVHASLIEMSNGNMCILGTDMGIFQTENLNSGTPTWNAAPEITGDVPVFDLKQQTIGQPEITLWFWDGVDTTYETYTGSYNFGYIYAATYGRGLFYTDKYMKPVGIINNDMPTQINSISVYPNPVSNQATIAFSLEENAIINVAVYNINGTVVMNKQMTEQKGEHQYSLDCSALPGGMYVVSISNGKTVQTGKFIVAQ